MSQYDKNIQIGDIITAYHKGYWKVTKVERRFVTEQWFKYGLNKEYKAGDEYSSLIYYQLVMDSKGNRPKKKPRIKSCDAAYCSKAINSLRDEIDKLEFIMSQLKSLEEEIKENGC